MLDHLVCINLPWIRTAGHFVKVAIIADNRNIVRFPGFLYPLRLAVISQGLDRLISQEFTRPIVSGIREDRPARTQRGH